MTTQCKATAKDGSPCPNPAIPGQDKCRFHLNEETQFWKKVVGVISWVVGILGMIAGIVKIIGSRK